MKIKVCNIFKLNCILNFVLALFVFVLIVDPADVLLGLKIPLFGLLFLLCLIVYPRIYKSFLLVNISIYVILLLTSILGFVLAYDTDDKTVIFFYKTFLMMLLLPWISHLEFLGKLTFPMIIVSFVVIFIYIAMQMFPQLEIVIYALANGPYFGTILMGRRTFVGIELTSVYYTSVPLFILPMGVYFYRLFNNKPGKFRNVFIGGMLFIAIMMGATRTAMLAAVGVIGLIILSRMWLSRSGKRLAIILGVCGFVLGIFVLNILLSDVTEISNATKQSLFYSFIHLINENPLILLFGQGVGATFDTGSVRGIASLSEWTYLELIRWFGVPLACVVIVIYIYPLFVLYKNKKILQYQLPLTITYIFYLLIAATNPYLFGSNGILALLVMYSYAFNPIYRKGYAG